MGMMDLITMIFYLGCGVIVLVGEPRLSDKEYDNIVINKKVHDLVYLVVQRSNIPISTVYYLYNFASWCHYQFFVV
jgi:hypothetical protein